MVVQSLKRWSARVGICFCFFVSHCSEHLAFGQVPEDFTFQIVTNLELIAGEFPCLQSRLGDVDVLALVDTGCTLTVVDSRLEKQLEAQSLLLGRKTNESLGTAGGRIKSVEYEALRFQIDNKEAISLQVQSVDLHYVQQTLGEKVHLIVGYEFLRRGAMGYAKSKGQFYLGRRNQKTEWRTSIPLVVDRFRIFATERLPWSGEEIRFKIDSGDRNPLTLEPRLFAEGVARGEIRQVKNCFELSLAGHRESRSGRMSSLEVFGQRFENLVVREGDGNRIGLGLLKRFDFEIDFISNQILVGTDVDNMSTFPEDISGIAVGVRGDRLVVVHNQRVASGILLSLESEDVLREWNGDFISSKNLADVRARLMKYPTDQPNQIVIDRKGELLELR